MVTLIDPVCAEASSLVSIASVPGVWGGSFCRPSDSSLCRWPSGGFSFSVLLALASLPSSSGVILFCTMYMVCAGTGLDVGTSDVARGSPGRP